MGKLGWFVVVLLFLAGPAAARDIYVSNTAGNDRFSGSQPKNLADTSGPVRTLAKAVRLAGPGDHIILADTGRPYREGVSLVGSRGSGNAGGPLVIDGNGAVLDGSAPIPPEQWKHERDNVFRFRPPQMGCCRVFLDGHAAVCVPAKFGSDVPPKLQPHEWCSEHGFIYFAVDAGKLPADYKLAYACLPTGITLYQVDRVVIKDLVLQGFQLDGIAAENGARSVVLEQVTCRDNGRSGLSVGGASQVELDGCTLAGNGTAQLRTLPYCWVHVYRSELTGDSAPGWVDQGGRVYLAEKRVQGGRQAVHRADAPRKTEPAEKPTGQQQPELKEGEL
jgi:hypothetical protein